MAPSAQGLQVGALVAPAIAHVHDMIDFLGSTEAAGMSIEAEPTQWFLLEHLSTHAPPVRRAVVVHPHPLAVLAFPVLVLMFGTEPVLGKFGATGPPTRFERRPRQCTPHAIVIAWDRYLSSIF